MKLSSNAMVAFMRMHTFGTRQMTGVANLEILDSNRLAAVLPELLEVTI